MDALTIKKITWHFTQRKFKPPTNTQSAWSTRLNTLIPWAKVWGIKSLFATPRDQITWLKLQHRNLYVAPSRDDPNDHSCPLCTQHQNQLHLVQCGEIRRKMWTPLITLLSNMGIPKCDNTYAFLTVGRIDQHTVIDRNASAVLFIAWRCLYAELVAGRIDNTRPNIHRAYQRTLTLLITRLTAYGEGWLKWVRKNRETGNKSHIPRKHQNKTLIRQDANGRYTINPMIFAEWRRVRQPT